MMDFCRHSTAHNINVVGQRDTTIHLWKTITLKLLEVKARVYFSTKSHHKVQLIYFTQLVNSQVQKRINLELRPFWFPYSDATVYYSLLFIIITSRNRVNRETQL